MIRIKRIKASALQFAILVASLVAILLSSFLLLTHTHRFFSKQSDVLIETVKLADNGIHRSLDPANKAIDSAMVEADHLSAKISKGAWGGYLKITARSSGKSRQFERVALAGAKVSTPPAAVYLSDNRLPLVMVGKSNIKGAVYISDKGVKAGVISGNYYTGTSLIEGSISVTSGTLPKLDDRWYTNLKELLENGPDGAMIIEVEGTLTNSFLEPSKFIYSPNDLNLGQQIVGNVIIMSDAEIIISASAQLTDVLVIAEKVTIEKGFTGTVHVVADSQITVEENVTLTYPSSLVVLDSNNEPDDSISEEEESIHVASESVIEGVIIYSNEFIDDRESEVAISISEDTLIRGSVYSTSNVELYGTVYIDEQGNDV